jgi:SAM-dependent methyltransferase
MRELLLELLADPVDGSPLELADAVSRDGEIESATLLGGGGRAYAVMRGIPRLVVGADPDQEQTRTSFAYKWSQRDSFGSEGMRRELHGWLFERYGFADAAAMRRYFGSRGRILDAGCGAGFATSAWMDGSWSERGAHWVGLDISDAIDVAQERLAGYPGTHFVQGDVSSPPFRNGAFDLIFSEGVLHHTPSTERAFAALVPLLAPGGELMIYVYRRKAPIREFTDDYVRGLLADLSPEEAWDALRPLTRLGQALAELGTEVEVPADVPLLGIRAGRYDVQRLLYWHVAKLFWNPELTFEENVHLNFDWYAPRYAHRHTEEQVRSWFGRAGLEITRLDAQAAGFTVRGVKP